MQVFPIVS